MIFASNSQIAKAIYLALKGKVGGERNEAERNVVSFLFRRGFSSRISRILPVLAKLEDKEEDRISARVISGRKLSDNVKREISAIIRKHYKKKHIALKEEIKEDLIGGFRIEAGDEVVDLTLKHKLKELQAHLQK